jgi:hypothetical protein
VVGTSIRSFSINLHSPHIPIKEVALKEWGIAINGLARGEQVLLVRKGGIMEETRDFRLEETSFYLYPTYEHQRADLIKEPYRDELHRMVEGMELPPKQVTITHAAHVTDDIMISDAKVLQLLDGFHILTSNYAEERLNWKADKPLHILIVRTYHLTQAKTIPVADAYIGCKSWITLQQPIVDTDLVPVLSDEEFACKRQGLLHALGIMHD